jgi:peroxiredoxin
MKRLIFAFALFIGLTGFIQAQILTWQPEKPIPGEKIRLQFNTQNSILAGVEKLDVVAVVFKDQIFPDPFQVIDLDLVPNDAGYTAELVVPKGINLVHIGFRNSVNEKKENNNGKGFPMPIYQADRKTISPAAKVSEIVVQLETSRLLGIERNMEIAFSMACNLFEDEPSLQKDANFLLYLSRLTASKKDEKWTQRLRDYAIDIQNDKKASDSQMHLALNMLETLNKKEEAKSFLEIAKMKYPKGQIAKQGVRNRFLSEKELDAKVVLFNQWRSFPNFPNEGDELGNMASRLASMYLKKKDWPEFEKYFNLMSDKTRQAGMLNSVAWDMLGAGTSTEVKADDLEKGTTLSKRSLDLLQLAMKENPDKRPFFSSIKDYKQSLEYSYHMYSDTYAVGLYRQGKYAEALKYQLLVCGENKFSDLEMNERYAIYLEKAEGGPKAEMALGQMIADGHATQAMKDQFKRLFAANNSPEAAAAKYLNRLEDVATAKKIEEIKKKKINDEAPDFTLKNLNGETVSLSSLRGKTVVLDFWATWCGPCIASFPGMQKAQNEHQEQKDVVFLFVDTWENGENKEKLAGDFIKSKGYAFQVLMDNDNKVVTSYKVSGIPTKFIIGPDGRIKFKSVGFSGSTDGVVTEVSQMIKLAGEVKP